MTRNTNIQSYNDNH